MTLRARLIELLAYEPETGIFTWRKRRGGRALAGTKAGVLRSDGYVSITIDFKKIMAHRLAWLMVNGVEPPDQLDHINGVRSDNRIHNLRPATGSQNQQNIGRAKSNNLLGLLGVSYHPQSGKFRGRIKVNGRVIHCGLHDTPEGAHAAYMAQKRISHTHLRGSRSER